MNRLPEEVLWQIFSYLLCPKDLCRCSRVCKKWNRVIESSGTFWEQLLLKCTPTDFRKDPIVQENLVTPKAKFAAFACAWSTEDHSQNIYVKQNGLTLHRKPVAQSTDAIRGKRGFSSGEHYWTVVWHGPNFGSSALVGLATKKAVMHGEGYFALLGADHESWGWDLSRNVLRHGGETICKYPQEESLKVSIMQSIGVTLDMTRRTLAFDVDGKYLGIAFCDLPNEPLYPAISAVYGNSEISLIYHGSPVVG